MNQIRVKQGVGLLAGAAYLAALCGIAQARAATIRPTAEVGVEYGAVTSSDLEAGLVSTLRTGETIRISRDECGRVSQLQITDAKGGQVFRLAESLPPCPPPAKTGR